MKLIIRKLSLCWVFLASLFITTNTKAAVKKDIAARVNKIRKAVKENEIKSSIIELTGSEFANNKHSGDWVNWGNWGNWNNWRNWDNWNNWSNWGNWRNW
jgi:hypothetical protein